MHEMSINASFIFWHLRGAKLISILNISNFYHTYEKKSIKSSNQLSKIKSFYNDSFKKKPAQIKSFNKNKNSLIYTNLTTKINENNIHINKISSFKKKISNYFLILRGYIYLLLGCFLSTIVNFLFQHATRNKIDSTIIVFYRGINLCIFTSFYIFGD